MIYFQKMREKIFVVITIITYLSYNSLLYGMTTIVIPSPGIYNFGSPLEFALSGPDQSCIIIDSSDVILDLSNYSIRQATGFEQPGSIGIFINPNLRNITIRNGTISDMDSFGIYVSDNNDTIKFENLIINNVTNAGIKLDSMVTGFGIRDIEFDNVEVKNVFSINDDAACGILLKNVTRANFNRACIVSQIHSETGNCYGVKLKNCSTCFINNIISSNNEGGGLRTAGYFMINSNSCIFKNCLAVDNICLGTSINSIGFGFDYVDSSRNILESSIAVGTVSTYTACSFRASNVMGIQFLKCRASSSTSQLSDAIGFLSEGGAATKISECFANGNRGAVNGYGVLLRSVNLASTIENNQFGLNLGTTGTSFGINLDSTFNSYIHDNQVDHHSGGVGGYGIYDQAGALTTNIILGNTSIKNTTAFSPGSPTIPVYSGDLSGTPGLFENVML